MRTRIFLPILVALGAAHCAEDGRSGARLDEPVQLVRVEPDAGGVASSKLPTITLWFDGYLEPASVAAARGISLTSGGFNVPVRAHWDIVDRALRITPVDPLVPGLSYTLNLAPRALETVSGRAVGGMDPFTFSVASDASSATPEPRPQVTFRDIEPVLMEHCGCHSEPVLGPVDASMVGARSSAMTDRWLVRPFEPASSYLMQKLVADYPDRFGTVMPPAWGDAPPLSDEQLRAVQDWIAGGAPID